MAMRLGLVGIMLWAGLAVAGAPRDGICNVREYGATGDGKTNDGAAIQRAIEDCAKAGGGVALLPAGNYLSGSVVLRSHITLAFCRGRR